MPMDAVFLLTESSVQRMELVLTIGVLFQVHSSLQDSPVINAMLVKIGSIGYAVMCALAVESKRSPTFRVFAHSREVAVMATPERVLVETAANWVLAPAESRDFTTKLCKLLAASLVLLDI